MKIQVNFIVAGDINPLNAELNPICHLLALLGTHPILHVSRVRVKLPLKCSLGMKYVLWCWNNRGGKNIRRTRRNVTFYVVNFLLFFLSFANSLRPPSLLGVTV